MELEKISITHFRISLQALFRVVRTGKKQVIVQRHNKDYFKVVKLSNNQKGVECPAVKIKSCTSGFLDLLEDNDYVFISQWGRRRVACTRNLAA